MSVVSFSRLFSMSAFEAVRTIRDYQLSHRGIPISQIVALIRSIAPDAAGHDYDAGLVLDELVAPGFDQSDPVVFYRACIDATISRNSLWTKLVVRGRRKFTDKLGRDEAQCFRAAGLLIEPPTLEVVRWWDRTAGLARLSTEQEKLERAREAERLTIAREIKLLQSLGIALAPVWMAIEDNTAGYDVLSYRPGSVGPINRLIEVKSTISSPLRFFLTRNEWNTAAKFGVNYVFHIWDLQSMRLYERTVADIAPHIPLDSDRGRWATVEIPIIQENG